MTNFLKTEYILKNTLDLLREAYKYEFCLVNMVEIEKRLEEKDLNLLSVLSDKEMEHFYSLKIKKNRIQWVSGRYAVKSALFKYKMSGSRLFDLTCIDILKGEDSAPYILQYPELCVSITHSFPYCIGIVSKNRIGVDIERVEEPEPSLIEYFYNKNEKEDLKCFEGVQFSQKTMTYWTRKEAASKVFKLGMKMDFKGLDTSKEKISFNNRSIRFKSAICQDFCVSIAFEDDMT
ncbi:4'-phosphopantetheinyl transferase [Pseudobacteroides cellulosolvens ATCC 35603 = DSM 2933]|uniref:4'-phosphopantetheinyl transferase n=2 Tax=Pseudobacteroides cellulosolvens TaxID=35825 RepID=A0A0L6JK27_9FIRM|nr:4'-phosphopantetheinyl transferase [Pseudobacteroides cellulosolvens ATCC 35603 = DSM 2933]